jgi:hypothetical protein
MQQQATAAETTTYTAIPSAAYYGIHRVMLDNWLNSLYSSPTVCFHEPALLQNVRHWGHACSLCSEGTCHAGVTCNEAVARSNI